MIDSRYRSRRSGALVPLTGHWQDGRYLLYLDTDPNHRQWSLRVFDLIARRCLRRLDLDQTIQSIGKPA